MTDKIKVYCDVDGVLNLNPRVHSYTHKERIVRQLPLINRSVSLNLRFKKDILDELNELPLSIYWLSTWNNDALRIFKKLGLELEQHVVPYNRPSDHQTKKLVRHDYTPIQIENSST